VIGQPTNAWALVRRQHGVVSRRQLLGLGLTQKAIDHRLAVGRLHKLRAGVYAVGRPRLTQHGEWMAAVLSCAPNAALSHGDAGGLWQITPIRRGPVHVSVTGSHPRCGRGILVHRRRELVATQHQGIPVTSPVHTLVDLAAYIERVELEAAVNEADKLDLVTPEELRAALDDIGRRPGLAALRELLDRQTFTLTDSELERRFLPIAREAGLPPPQTGRWLNGYKVDFYWPELGLVVETDGLRYHRTPTQQARDLRRDHAHTAAGLNRLRFTHADVRYERDYVRATLARVTRMRG
jgi:very-short-patch-repair endonuclease